MLTVPTVRVIDSSSSHHLRGPERSKSVINLPAINQNMKSHKSSRAIPGTASSDGRRRPAKREKVADFDPDKIATEDRYRQLQEIFDASEEGLDIDEFKVAMRKTVGHNMTDDEIELLFMKVDANCDMHVDWEEYVTYNLLEYQGKSRMIEMMRVDPFPAEIALIPCRHRDAIVSIDFYPSMHKRSHQNQFDQTAGRYLTLSKDGHLSVWSIKMKHLNSYNLSSDFSDRAMQPWLVDMACMFNVGMVAIASTDRDITIYDLQGVSFMKRYYLTGIDDCITCMSYCVDKNDLNNAILAFGDTSGSVCVVAFSQCLQGALFGSYGAKKNAYKQVSIPEIIRGFHPGARGYRFNRIHSDWVLQVKYIPDLSACVSCCQNTNDSLCMYQFQKKRTSSVFKVNKGILCFDYCPENNIIVTGGMDYWIRVYNPYVNIKPIFVIKGHVKPVSQVVIDPNRNLVISIDKGKNLRVHDLKDQSCLQQMSGRVVRLGPNSLSSFYYNPALKTLLLATNQIGLLQKTSEEAHVAEIISHNKPVVTALYNKTFNCVVSACLDSVISVWDLKSGVKVIQTVNAHVRYEKGNEVPVEITTMTFDGPQRRVISGARDGSVKVWNFNNGNCLQTFNLPDGHEISGVCCSHHHIFVTGWSRVVHVYVDGGDEDYRKDWAQKHKEDILCMAQLDPGIIATASYDGDIVVWSRGTGQAYCTLNASRGIHPIDERKEVTTEQTVDNADTDHDGTETEDQSAPMCDDFEIPATSGEPMVTKTRKLSLLPNSNREVQNTEKDNTLLKPSCSRKSSDVDINHPLLPLFEAQSPVPPDVPNEKSDCEHKISRRREEYDELCTLYESAIECILFLESRDRESGKTAIMLTSGAEGWVRAWSIHHEGGLLGQFNASHSVGESVHTMCTDSENGLLFTADSQGYIKTWDISEYCTQFPLSSSRREMRWQYLNELFTFIRFTYNSETPPQSFVSEKMPPNIENRPPPTASMPKMTLKWPLLVNSFRGHMKIINKIEYIRSREFLITASNDCSVRLWTLNGVYIGTFGEPWKTLPTPQPRTRHAQIRAPTELRRIGSARTLKVLHQGQSRLWKFAIDKVMFYNRLLPPSEVSDDESEADEFECSSGLLKPDYTGDKLVVERSDRRSPPSSARRPRPKKPGGSDILGKSYKKTMQHKMPPTVDKFVEINSSVGVYHCLPFSELSLEDPAQSSSIEDIRQKYYGEHVLMRMKGEPKKQEKGIITLFKQITDKQTLPKGKTQTGRIRRVRNKVLTKAAANKGTN